MNNLEFGKQMQERTMEFAVQVMRFFCRLPKTDEARILGRQLLRSATSVAANYRAVCRSKSDADFISKLGTVVEEADETAFWIELLERSSVCPSDLPRELKQEAGELLLIVSASLRTAKSNARKEN